MALDMRSITKSFGANQVLKGVDFAVMDGEITALIGENGAGKTTLMNILGGVLQADAGEIIINEYACEFDTPKASLDEGVAFIHQELNLVGDLNVVDNLFLGRELRRGPFLDRTAMLERTHEVLEWMGVSLDPNTMVRDLDASYKQVVEIARALLMDARILIMDEPTTSLTESEIRHVFGIMRSIAAQGVSIVFISHKLREVKTVCDTYTVLRDGNVVAKGHTNDVTEQDLARFMVGHEVGTHRLRDGMTAFGAPVLEVEGLTRFREFEDVSFLVREGEVLGFTGLLGDGRSELFQTIFGARGAYEGDIYVNGELRTMRSTTEAFRAGIGYVPRDRKENGILKDLSILDNGTLVTLAELRRGPFIDRRRQVSLMNYQINALSIKVPGLHEPITSLSGGNQQKVVLAKWLGADPEVLIFDNPTQGVDVGAKEDIYRIILELAEGGMAVVVLSSEAQEIIRLCDRALVMYHGHIQGELRDEAITEHNIMQLAIGGTVQ